MNPREKSYHRTCLRVKQEATQVINTGGNVYKNEDSSLYRISCQCNAFKRHARDPSNSPDQQRSYQQACIITAGLFVKNKFLNEKITKQNFIDCSKTSRALSVLANTFSYWHQQDVCRKSVMHIAQYISQPQVLLSSFNSQELANVAHAFSQWSLPWQEIEGYFKAALQVIANHLIETPRIIEQSTVLA